MGPDLSAAAVASDIILSSVPRRWWWIIQSWKTCRSGSIRFRISLRPPLGLFPLRADSRSLHHVPQQTTNGTRKRIGIQTEATLCIQTRSRADIL